MKVESMKVIVLNILVLALAEIKWKSRIDNGKNWKFNIEK